MFHSINEDSSVTLKNVNLTTLPKFSDLFDVNKHYLVGFVDAETTGIEVEVRELIEVGIVRCVFDKEFNFLGVCDFYSDLQQPELPLSEKIIKFTGITYDDVKNKVFNGEKIKQMLNECAFLIAHNAKFDKSFLLKYNLVDSKQVWLDSFNMIDWLIDYGFPSGKLELLEHYHNFYVNAHRAFNDVTGLVHLLVNFPNKDNTYFKVLSKALFKKWYRVSCANTPFDFGYVFRDLGFRWNYQYKCWVTATSEPNDLIEKVKVNLGDNVFKVIRVDVKELELHEVV